MPQQLQAPFVSAGTTQGQAAAHHPLLLLLATVSLFRPPPFPPRASAPDRPAQERDGIARCDALGRIAEQQPCAHAARAHRGRAGQAPASTPSGVCARSRMDGTRPTAPPAALLFNNSRRELGGGGAGWDGHASARQACTEAPARGLSAPERLPRARARACHASRRRRVAPRRTLTHLQRHGRSATPQTHLGREGVGDERGGGCRLAAQLALLGQQLLALGGILQALLGQPGRGDVQRLKLTRAWRGLGPRGRAGGRMKRCGRGRRRGRPSELRLVCTLALWRAASALPAAHLHAAGGLHPTPPLLAPLCANRGGGGGGARLPRRVPCLACVRRSTANSTYISIFFVLRSTSKYFEENVSE